MARVVNSFLLLTSLVLMLSARSTLGCDSELVTDFAINVTSAADLTFTGFRNLTTAGTGQLGINGAFSKQFPALQGLGIGANFLRFGPGSINSIHSHPRSNEVVFVLSGSIDFGLVDSSNRLFTATLQAGDAFVIPKGLMHYQINRSPTTPATALAAFSSEVGNRVSYPPAIFNSNPRIASDILQMALHLDAQTVDTLTNFTFPAF